ncbi:MAG: hypothetical protein ORN24_06830 [Burkholderiales bacterium]|nr:hypothetical protein [Burkholderiales bacterium]
MKQKVLILGSISFVLDNAKVGINWIAEFLANQGYEVIYVSSASTPLDFFFKKKRERFKYAWLKGGKFNISANLTEIVFKTPWLLNRLTNRLTHRSAGILQQKLLNEHYAILISTVGALSLFVDKINAPLKVLRLQDDLNNFNLSKYVINNLQQLLRKQAFQKIWPVSNYLWQYAEQFKPKQNVLLSNGVNLTQYYNHFTQLKVKKVIYVGAFSSWVDIKLIIESASLLPDWQFDLFGDNFKQHNELPNNVFYQGGVTNDSLAPLLSRYSVGLIPFVDCEHILAVERPLKFYQYLASGLGIASTNYGCLQTGMGKWAYYGNSAQQFANAIINAADHRHSKKEIYQFLNNYTWDFILNKMLLQLNNVA